MENAEEWRRSENLSANCTASARSLARLGAYMTNGGTLDGKQIMTEEAVRSFHDKPKRVLDQMMGLTSVYTQGGV